jgi:hypothetical protein
LPCLSSFFFIVVRRIFLSFLAGRDQKLRGCAISHHCQSNHLAWSTSLFCPRVLILPDPPRRPLLCHSSFVPLTFPTEDLLTDHVRSAPVF